MLIVYRFLITLFVLFPVVASHGQTPVLSLGNVGVCSSDAILVPLQGLNLFNIGAITLTINYNQAQLTFKSLENIDPQIDGLLFNVLTNPSRVSIVWSSTTGVNFPDNILMNLKFDVISTSGGYGFAVDSSEVASASIPPEVILVDFVSGSFYPGNPVVAENPVNTTVASQTRAFFNVLSPDHVVYKWQASSNQGSSWEELQDGARYSGTGSNGLTVENVPLSFNNMWYRCALNKGGCLIFSAPAILMVDSLEWINDHDDGGLSIKVFPNPVSNSTTISYKVPESGVVTIELFSSTLQQIIYVDKRFHKTGQYLFDLNFVYLPSGLYLCNYHLQTIHDVYFYTKKIIKL